MKAARIAHFLKRYGRQAAITGATGESLTVSAMVTPLRYKNRMYLEGEFSAAGYIDGGHYLFISGFVDSGISSGGRLMVSGAQYIVKKWDVLYLGESPAFIWAILQLANKEGA